MQTGLKICQPKIWKPVGVKDLEPAAFEVVRSLSHKSVIAGPGSGKTELLAQRACYLLQTGLCPAPKRILAISYKKDAAKNLKDRVMERCHPEQAVRFESLTFDAFSKHLLDRFYRAIPERWRIVGDYRILLTNYRTFSDFLDSLPKPPEEIGTYAELMAVRRDTFEKKAVLGIPLPSNGFELHSVQSWASAQWWAGCLSGKKETELTFPMVGRLVQLLLRVNPLILSALQSTYAYVFLDEFQDTTHVQYDLVKTGFFSSEAILTAVGDNKQQIMRWAMALADPFGDFVKDFGAQRVQLIRNYRSSPELVGIQHQIALSVDASSTRAKAFEKLGHSENTCLILDFHSTDKEADSIAAIISDGVANLGLIPRDFAILVRQKPDDYKTQIIASLRKHKIKARVEAELQDILSERLTLIILAFLRLGATERGGAYWKMCFGISVNLNGIDPQDSKRCIAIESKLQKFHLLLRELLTKLPESKIKMEEILHKVIHFLNVDTIKLTYPEYRQGDWFESVLVSIASYLFSSCEHSSTWCYALDDFEGKDAVPIMTIHKSKGLEYHTIIFVGLDDSAWWSFRRQPEESRSAFFVAFSRAKQRVFFTYCHTRGKRKEIGSLYQILKKAGVESKAM
jgi:superfamily I DNA/RNA helicase